MVWFSSCWAIQSIWHASHGTVVIWTPFMPQKSIPYQKNQSDLSDENNPSVGLVEVKHIPRGLKPWSLQLLPWYVTRTSGHGSARVSSLPWLQVDSLGQVKQWDTTLHQVRSYLLGIKVHFAITWAVWANIWSRSATAMVFSAGKLRFIEIQCVAIRADFSDGKRNLCKIICL